ncbi:Oxygen-dependent choline dehydrogenase [Mycena venus]|uniref:Oxygen-dependent choline dehydrogenase n=1 Tax=Mycena venus TaxID=2733690 RepID=A0A8H7CSN4_9AGAR|nr:Oxygen-dependent choline dehydrogenase [Mycena venus]
MAFPRLLCFLAVNAFLICSPIYDFIVVGSGVGGGPLAARLAENGFSVVVVDSGHNVVNVNTTVPLYFGRAVDDPQIELNYTYHEYSPGAKFPRDDAWYPRARALGGSTVMNSVHNAMLNDIADTKQDFDHLAAIFNDSTWAYENMRKYFTRIEHNLYLSEPNPDHGFDGWLKTSLEPTFIINEPQFADQQLTDIVNTIATSGPALNDTNSAANVEAIGIGSPSYTIDENHNRSCVRDRLLDVQHSSKQGKGKLTFLPDTLATKVALCDPGDGGSPKAYGVEIAVGAALAVGSNFKGKQKLDTTLLTARHEVIVSAGVFQSPQLLMLSGIGDKNALQQHGINPVVHLPGVGTNLQDHDEVASIWSLKENYTLFDGCTFLYTSEDDPCLEYWATSGHANLYSFGPALFTTMSRTSGTPDSAQPDMLTYWVPAYFPGFFRGFAQRIADTHNALTGVVLKAHPSSRGVVQLTGGHPQDPLRIEKRHFEAPGGQDDIATMREAIRAAWALVASPNITMHVEARVFPDPQVESDEQIEDHILQNVFGHHACCTNPMGTDDDPNAVLDGNFKVRGVDSLRVVDISSWPTIPGFFVTTPTYMISEKAADIIAAAAEYK